MSRWICTDDIGSMETRTDQELVDSAPSIDIVRCKECKYARMTYGGECKYCEKWSLEDSLYLDGDFFCSYGERDKDTNVPNKWQTERSE